MNKGNKNISINGISDPISLSTYESNNKLKIKKQTINEYNKLINIYNIKNEEFINLQNKYKQLKQKLYKKYNELKLNKNEYDHIKNVNLNIKKLIIQNININQ
jgi:hypothetical protein